MQLTYLANLRRQNIIFKEPKEYQLKNCKLKDQRIKIGTNFLDSKKGQLVIETLFLFSFGIDERLNQETNQLAGYSMPVCLWQREEEPALEEKKFFDGMNNLLSICRNYLQEEYGHEVASLLCDIFYYKQTEYKDKKR